MVLQHHSHHTHPKSQRGTALWEMVFAAAVIIITGIFVIPEFIWYSRMECKITYNCDIARSSLRTLHSAQEVYQVKWGVYGSAAQLGPWPGGLGLIDEHMTPMTRHVSVIKSGYYFRMDCKPDGFSWCAIAWPTKWGTTGERAFQISTDGIIRWRDTEGTNPDWNPANYPKRLGE